MQLFKLSKNLGPSGKTESLMTRIMSDQLALCYSSEGRTGKLSFAEDGVLFILVKALAPHYKDDENAAYKALSNWVKQARERLSKR